MIIKQALFPLAALAWTAVMWLAFRGAPSPDIAALYAAAQAVANGQPALVYPPEPQSWDSAYLMPPLWAWLAAPLSQSLGALTETARALSLLMLTASLPLAYRILRLPQLSFPAFAAFGFVTLTLTAPALLAIGQSALTIFTLFLTLLAFERYRAGRFALSGILLAVTASLTLTPAFLALIFALDRNARAALGFAAGGAALAALSLALAGPDAHLQYLAQLSAVDRLVLPSPQNYALEALLFQGNAPAPEPLWLKATMSLATLASLTGLILMRPRLIASTAVPVLLLGVSLTTALFGTLASPALFLLPLLMLPALLHVMEPERAKAVILAALALQSQLALGFFSGFGLTALIAVLTFAGLLTLLHASVFRATRFEPDIPLHFR